MMEKTTNLKSEPLIQKPEPIPPLENRENNLKPERPSLLPKESSVWFWLSPVQKIMSILASLAVIIGVVIALRQLRQTDTIERQRSLQSEVAEKRRLAIESVGQTRSVEFLRAYRRLKVAYSNRYIEAKKMESLEEREEKRALIDSLNYVMNVYDSIAIMYNHNLADRCIIKENIYSGSNEIATFCDAFSYPEGYRKNFNILLALMEQQQCETQNP